MFDSQDLRWSRHTQNKWIFKIDNLEYIIITVISLRYNFPSHIAECRIMSWSAWVRGVYMLSTIIIQQYLCIYNTFLHSHKHKHTKISVIWYVLNHSVHHAACNVHFQLLEQWGGCILCSQDMQGQYACASWKHLTHQNLSLFQLWHILPFDVNIQQQAHLVKKLFCLVQLFIFSLLRYNCFSDLHCLATKFHALILVSTSHGRLSLCHVHQVMVMHEWFPMI